MAETAAAVIACLACLNAHLVNPVAERIKQFRSLKKNARDLSTKTEQLRVRKDDLERQIDDQIATDSTYVKSLQVENLTRRVNSFLDRSTSFDEDFNKRVSSCSSKFGCRKNYKLARRVAKLIKDADDLISEIERIKDVVVRDLLKLLSRCQGQLSIEVNKLRCFMDDKQKKLEKLISQNNCMEATASLKDWFSRVEGSLESGTKFHTFLETRAQGSTSSNSGGGYGDSSVPDLVTKANEYFESVNKLLEEEKNFTDEKMIQLSSVITTKIPMYSEVVGQIEILSKAVILINSDEAHIIGIQGMGGAGKTLLLDQINNHFCQSRSGFDVVVKMKINRDADIQKIQEELLGELGMEFGQDTVKSKAKRIYTRLKDKRFLLLMDDLWDTFELAEIGIPPLNEHDKKCVMVITTRDEWICHHMYIEDAHMIKIELLSSENSWKLFRRQLRENQRLQFIKDHSLEKMAREVADECGCLPLALVVLGRAMRHAKQFGDWENAKVGLQENTLDYLKDVINTWKFSYDRLQHHEQQVLLYYSLWPEGSRIPKEDLIDMLLVEEGVFDNMNKKVDRSRLVDITISVLLDVGLLMEERKHVIFPTFYKLHDCVRDMAVKLTDIEIGTSKVFLRWRSGQKWKEFYSNKWNVAKRISMNGSEVQEIPKDEMYDCDNQVITLLWREGKIARIPKKFFRCMTHLVVLDLSGTFIQVISSSIGDLHSLKYLNLCETCIRKLPKQIGKLVGLIQLILGGTRSLQHIPSESISKLCKLEKLDMLPSAYKWKWKEEEEFDPLALRKLTLSDLEVLAEKAVLSDVAISIIHCQKSLLEELANSEHVPITWCRQESLDNKIVSDGLLGNISFMSDIIREAREYARDERWDKLGQLSEMLLGNCLDIKE